MEEITDDETTAHDIKEQLFHTTVREQTIFLLLCILLYSGSYALIKRFRRSDHEDLYSSEEDEVKVYRMSLWMCTFSLAVAIGAALLLPLSIASNEILLLYPNSYYVKWLNSSLVQGMWTYVFLFSNLCLFVLLPFSYLLSESAGFVGHKKGVIARVYETFTVFSLLAVTFLGITYLISALLGRDSTILSLFSSQHLPFLYSCGSFFGVLLLLVCTPLGFVRLFGVVGQVLVKPHLLRDVDSEFDAFNMEEASVRRKLAATKEGLETGGCLDKNGGASLDHIVKIAVGSPNVVLVGNGTVNINNNSKLYNRVHLQEHKYEKEFLHERLREIEADKNELDKLRSSSSLQRNFVYPIAMLGLLLLTSITVLLVIQNTLEILIGLKALPLSTRQFTLGISSLSKLGVLGAALEVLLILYLGAASTVGFYTMPFMKNVRPRRRKTSLSQLILNCALVLILSSALPLLSRIIGITNFDLLGEFGEIEWLGNFQIVFLYNLIFGTATTLCVVNKFTGTVRRELFARLRSVLHLKVTFMLWS